MPVWGYRVDASEFFAVPKIAKFGGWRETQRRLDDTSSFAPTLPFSKFLDPPLYSQATLY